MVKKVVDVPDNADYITAHEQINAGGSFLLQKYNVADLPDAPTVAESAPKKRVIELPADSIAWLERMKSNLETVDVYDLFHVLTDTSGSYVSYQLNFNSETAALNTVAEWVLGHVEFVPKNEPRFVVEVDRHEYIYASFIGSAIGKKTVDFWKIPQEVTEEEADELVAGLTALNARKVKAEE